MVAKQLSDTGNLDPEQVAEMQARGQQSVCIGLARHCHPVSEVLCRIPKYVSSSDIHEYLVDTLKGPNMLGTLRRGQGAPRSLTVDG